MDQEIVVLPAQEKDLGNEPRTMNSATYVKYTVDAQGNIKYTELDEATITVKTAAERGYKEAVKTLTVKVGLAKPSFTPSKSSKLKKSFVVTSSAVKGSEGWEVQYSLKSNMKSSVTKTFADAGAKLSRKTITANKSNKIYYVRVRSYATVNGQKSYSEWSAVKPVVST